MKKRYADGGATEGENVNIDDDTRMRARAAIARRMAGQEEETPKPAAKRIAPKIVASKPSPKAADKEEAPGPSGRPRDNVAPSGRGAVVKPAKDPVAEARANEVPKPMGQNMSPREESRLERFGRGAKELAEKALPPLGIGAGVAGLGVGAKKLYDMYKSGRIAKDVATQSAARPRQMLEAMAAREAEKRAARSAAGKRKLDEDAFKGEGESFGLEGAFKKGGRAKSYSGGGSVRGSGIAQRGVRKCKVV